MLVDLLNVTTDDGLRLDGVLRTPAEGVAAANGVDAVIILHGTGSNFYSSNLLAFLADMCLERGAATLNVNTRGHDGISTTAAPVGLRLQGAAYELIDACCHDIGAWITLARQRGYERIGLVGHSLGAVKAIYSQAQRPDQNVQWIVAVSPPRLSHSAFVADGREGFVRDYERALALVRAEQSRELIEVRFPIPYALSADGFIDKYGPDERYNVLRLIERVACPTVFVYGTQEMSASVTFRGMPELIEQIRGGGPRQVHVVSGADHIYSGCYAELQARIDAGLRKLITG